jgi:hypothetical protein
MKKETTPKEIKQQAISDAIKFLSTGQRKKVLGFIFLLPVEWNSLINESVKKLNLEQLQKVLEFIATMPAEGRGDEKSSL